MYLRSHLNKYLPQGDKGCTKLCEKQAADEEIPLVISEELRNRQSTHRLSKQTSMEKTQLTFKESFRNSLLRVMGKYQDLNMFFKLFFY